VPGTVSTIDPPTPDTIGGTGAGAGVAVAMGLFAGAASARAARWVVVRTVTAETAPQPDSTSTMAGTVSAARVGIIERASVVVVE
jgi:hypothetical protein